ncbi:MAG: helix-turn-helix domain-containing protein [Paludibacteraceae bacterium]|nr:helix-turn-helix domain-containing protein [Paludibacteraceae bacterium]
MKVDEVPQDLKYFENTVLRDVAYAVDENGKYTSVISDGWSVKNDALELTMDGIYEECEEIRQRVLAGETSLLEYYAAKNIMDVDLLSDYTGISKRTIRKHFDPKVFSQLDRETLEKYADALRITVEQLTTIPE